MVRPRRTGSHIGSPGEQLLVRGALQATFMESLGLDPPILDAVRALGIDEFTEPQVRAIPRILAGANVLLVAPPGIGKTEAAFLPILQPLLREKPAPPSGSGTSPDASSSGSGSPRRSAPRTRSVPSWRAWAGPSR